MNLSGTGGGGTLQRSSSENIKFYIFKGKLLQRNLEMGKGAVPLAAYTGGVRTMYTMRCQQQFLKLNLDFILHYFIFIKQKYFRMNSFLRFRYIKL